MLAEGMYRNGIVNKQKYFVPCNEKDVGATHRNTHRRDTWDFTVGYILTWLGIIVYYGATIGASGSVLRYQQSMPYGVYAPMVQHFMNRDTFEFARHYIHFTDNT